MKPIKYSIKLLSILAILIMAILFLDDYGFTQRTKSSQNAGEQKKSEKGLKDNKYFFSFIDSSVTNFGTEKEKNLFKKAIQRDILSHILYMKFLFKESFIEIRKIQKILIDLYRLIYKRDFLSTKSLLNNYAPMVILGKECKAIKYLKFGYRDMRSSKRFFIMAENLQENLYSMRLYKYVRVIKKAKHGKRYAFLAMIAAKNAVNKKKEPSKLGFEKLKGLISRLSPPDKKENNRLIHLDNFYRSKDDKSFYNLIWDNPNLHEIDDYERYMDVGE